MFQGLHFSCAFARRIRSYYLRLFH
uniref:Uncharacterized protein n=1 Tax=Arundo donax TaxID=35708 RepID=A0A0A9BLC6_ARUDO